MCAKKNIQMKSTNTSSPDVVLIGAGIMSATLGMLLKELDPNIRIDIYERLDVIAGESSDAWNNAGTGHSAFCELNYTPESKNKTINTSKAIKIAEQFEVSKQFWAYLVEQNYIADPSTFINPIPHLSFVWGAENVSFLQRRYEALIKSPLFKNMKYTEEFPKLKEWMPLIMEGRNAKEKIAATRMDAGTDIDFGDLTRLLFKHLTAQDGVNLFLKHDVDNLKKTKSGHWKVVVKDLVQKKKSKIETKFVFIGAGGGALPLLEKSDIPEGSGYGGFPVSGKWLVCYNEMLIKQHAAKVYGKAEKGSPPMSVPHLDTRVIDGKRALLFGPFAGFSTKFLKQGSYLDLPSSLQLDNIFPMLAAGYHNLSLTKYLITQVRLSREDRLAELQKYVPTAQLDDWKLQVAGQRVQVIKRDKKEGGILEFGTELVSASDGSLAVLLGASPGASTAVSAMLDVLKRCFKDKMNSPEWKNKLKTIIPSYGHSLDKDTELCDATRRRTNSILKIEQ